MQPFFSWVAGHVSCPAVTKRASPGTGDCPGPPSDPAQQVPGREARRLGGTSPEGARGRCRCRPYGKDGGRSRTPDGVVSANGLTSVRTYAVVVRATEGAQAVLRQLAADLEPDWETTTVEFKRRVILKRDKEKTEFVRDVLGLATTKAPLSPVTFRGTADIRLFNPSVSVSAIRYSPCGSSSNRLRQWAAAVV